MEIKTITDNGITLKVGRNKKGVFKTEVHSILDAFNETPSSFYAWCDANGLQKRPGWLTVDQFTSFLSYLAEFNEPAREYMMSLIDLSEK